MAMISEFEEFEMDHPRRHGPVTCRWLTFREDGEQILQLLTDGSMEPQVPSKASQTLQRDRTAAEALVGGLKTAFSGLGSRST